MGAILPLFKQDGLTRKDLRDELKSDDMSPHYLQWNQFDAAVLEEMQNAFKLDPYSVFNVYCKYNSKLSHFAYWYLLGTIWNGIDKKNGEDFDKWIKLFGHDRPKRNACLMKPSEATKLRLLPKMIEVFWDKTEKAGITYLLEKPTNDDGKFIASKVSKDKVIALFDRKEGKAIELIILNAGDL